MKRVYVGLIVFVSVFVLAAGGFFIFGGETSESFESENGGIVSDTAEVSLDIEGNGAEDLSGGAGGDSVGEGSDGGSSGGSDDVGFVCSEWQPVQYSIGNFVENIECLVYGVGGCDRVKATCGAEVFNLDYDLGGIFGIRFSLFSEDEEIEFEVVEADIGARERSSLVAEIFVDGSFDVGSLKCVIDSESVPAKCLG